MCDLKRSTDGHHFKSGSLRKSYILKCNRDGSSGLSGDDFIILGQSRDIWNWIALWIPRLLLEVTKYKVELYSIRVLTTADREF